MVGVLHKHWNVTLNLHCLKKLQVFPSICLQLNWTELMSAAWATERTNLKSKKKKKKSIERSDFILQIYLSNLHANESLFYVKARKSARRSSRARGLDGRCASRSSGRCWQASASDFRTAIPHERPWWCISLLAMGVSIITLHYSSCSYV